MPLQATSGAASYDGFGGGAAAVPNYIEDVFSTYLYTGNGSTQTITNGIDLSTKGGMVWIKNRSGAYTHVLVDTARGTDKVLCSNNTNAEQTGDPGFVTQFNTNGFAIGDQARVNLSSSNFVSWTFRKQPKFFDVVTYTGDGNASRTVSHNLGSVPGCIIVKTVSSANDWVVSHRSLVDQIGFLNQTWEFGASAHLKNSLWTSTTFTPGNAGATNQNGVTYVAYLFAHDAGGFGLTGADNVITCGSFTTDGSGNATVTLGYEPQWIIWRNSQDAANWWMADNMRGMTANGTDAVVYANLSDAEASATDMIAPTATGFRTIGGASWANNKTHIYIAIRRGPMKTPTTGTSVFYPQTISQANTIDSTNVPFPPDLVNTFSLNGTDRISLYTVFTFVDRLRGLGVPSNTYTASGPTLTSSSTAAENTSSGAGYVQLKADGQNITRSSGWNDPLYGNWIYYFMRRAPGFFDVVCYTGNSTARTISHNLSVVPEMMILKSRSHAANWLVYHAAMGNTKYFRMNTSDAVLTATVWNDTTPTSTVFSVGSGATENGNAYNYVWYGFASCPGVSKVGSYTGTGTTQQINCGFTGGARFVLIKRTDSTGDWYVWDSARGIVAGNDSYLVLNSTAAEVTNTDWVDTYSAGFELSNAAGNNVNINTATYIFLSVA